MSYPTILRDDLPEDRSFIWFILFGLCFRIVLLPSDPFLSDDIYRYLWDGKILAGGINPYQYAPVDIHLQQFRDQIIFPFINFPDIATSYPPVSQLIFFINYWFGGSVLSWKILLMFFELSLFLMMYKLVKHFGLNKYRLLIYFYNPLLIIETYSSGHLEITGISLFWIGVYLFYKHHDFKSIIFFAMSILTKFITLMSSLPFLTERFFRKSTFLVLLCILIFSPFLLGGIIPVPGIFSYISLWEFNGGIYQTVISMLKLFGVKEYHWVNPVFPSYLATLYVSYAFYYKVCAVIILLAVIIYQLKRLRILSDFRTANFIQKSFFLTAVLLILTPTLHPWYLLWIIPFLVIIPNWSWLFFTFLIQASYFVLKDYALTSDWKESVWILLFQYIPFYALLIWEYFDGRKIKGWFLV